MSIELVQLTATLVLKGDAFPEDNLLDPHEYVVVDRETGDAYGIDLEDEADEVAEADIYLVYMDAFPESNIELSIAVNGLEELFAETWPTLRNILDATPMTNEETVRLILLLSTTEDHWAYELIGILDMTAVPDNGLPSTTSYKIVPVEGDAQP